MKRFLLLGAMALALSGCVSDYPDYGGGYDPYPEIYEARPVVVYEEQYRRRPIYRDYRPDYREPYRRSYRDDRRRDRRDDRRQEFSREEARRPDRERPPRREPEPVSVRPRPQAPGNQDTGPSPSVDGYNGPGPWGARGPRGHRPYKRLVLGTK